MFYKDKKIILSLKIEIKIKNDRIVKCKYRYTFHRNSFVLITLNDFNETDESIVNRIEIITLLRLQVFACIIGFMN